MAKIAHFRVSAGSACRAVLIAVFVLATRFWALGEKPFHHDESMFAHRAYHLRTTGDYAYEPILHGPFLQDATALVFLVFGDSDFTARLIPAVSGVLILALVWGLRGGLGNLAALLAILMLAVSPTLLYYSRFCRNDVPFALAAMTFIFCMARLFEGRKLRWWLLALLSVAWMICIKETYVIFLFTVATFAIGVAIVERTAGVSFSSHQTRAKSSNSGRKFIAVTVAGVAAGLGIIVVLFTTFFQHLNHADGPIEAIRYWAGQHAEHRIYGEFHYYIPLALIYEFLPLALVVSGVARTARRTAWLRGTVAWAWLVGSVILLAALWGQTFSEEFEAVVHMSRGWHLWLAIQALLVVGAACAALLAERKPLPAFFLWWFLVSFLAYSYAGEKVPWVGVHVFLPMIVAAGFFLQEILQGKPAENLQSKKPFSFGQLLGAAALVFAFIGTAAIGLRLSFVNGANPAERLVFTHTTPEFKAMVEEIRDLIERSVPRPAGAESKPRIVANTDAWPSQWYFRRARLVQGAAPGPGLPFFIIDEYTDPNDAKTHILNRLPWLLRTHVVRRVPFREWWRQDTKYNGRTASLYMPTIDRLFQIWLALVPKQYRRAPLTDGRGNAVAWVGDPAGLPQMTVDRAVEASKRAWRCAYDYFVYRRDFDPYGFAYSSRADVAVYFCIRKDLYRKWLADGGRPEANRTRFVRAGRVEKSDE